MFAAIKLQWSVFVYDIPQNPTTAAAAAATTTTTVVIRSVMCSYFVFVYVQVWTMYH